MHLLKTALSYVAIFCVGAVTSVSCFEPEFGNPSFRCSPSGLPKDEADCPDDQKCCSDDPASTGGKIPNYFKPTTVDATYGTPLFSGNNNPLSTSGMCVKTGGFPSPFPSGCPIPCDPTWDVKVQTEICGDPAMSKCCQMQELDPNKDCVLDNNVWRAVTGADIGTEFSGVRETWGPLHSTNQDPDGLGCMAFAAGGGTFSEAALNDCLDQLTVANRRGFCYAPTECPCIEDVCALKNGAAPKCGAAAGTTMPTTMPATM